MEMTYKCGCSTEVSEQSITERFGSLAHAQEVYSAHRCEPCDYEAMLPEEKEWLNVAHEKALALGHTFTERDVLQGAWNNGYELYLQYDPRFVKTEDRRDGFPLWTIA